jgi:hypothetical protein
MSFRKARRVDRETELDDIARGQLRLAAEAWLGRPFASAEEVFDAMIDEGLDDDEAYAEHYVVDQDWDVWIFVEDSASVFPRGSLERAGVEMIQYRWRATADTAEARALAEALHEAHRARASAVRP